MKKRLLAMMLVLVMVLTFSPLPAFAVTTSSYQPYAKIDYGYSSGVTCGTIRYISQVPSGAHFNSSYWPTSTFGGYAGASSECGTASMSMALSYIGINKTPKTILETNNGYTVWTGWGAEHNTPSVSTAISNYINGNGKYSPPMIHIPNYSSAGHYVLIIGKISENSFQILDPWECTVTSMTISGTTATYSKGGSTVNDSIDQVHQWYNANASLPASTCTVTFNANGGSCSTSTKTVTIGGSIGTLPTATRTGYNFDGWYTAASGGTKISTSTTFSSNTTVYAHWTVKTAQVSMYDADGSTWQASTVNVGTSFTLPSSYPTKSGSYFCGWAYTSGAENYDLRPGDSISVNSAVDIYPVFVSHEKAISGEVVYIYNINDFTDTDYDIKEKTVDVETKVDNSYWTSWSAYSTNAVTASSTVQVRTTPMYRYYYYLCPYCGAHEPFYGTSDCGKQIPSSAWHETWSTIPYSNSSYKSFSYTTAKYYTTSLGDGQLWCFSSGNVNNTAVGTKDTDGDAVVIKTGYSSRSYVTKIDTVTTQRTGYVITLSGCKHSYTVQEVPGTCTDPAHTIYTCSICGESYTEYADELYGEWLTEPVAGMPEQLTQTKTQYRTASYETKTSYNTSESGWTQKSSTWERSGSGTVEYVKSWPSGFNTSHSLYVTYNKSPKSNSETATEKTTVNSNYVSGYIYYHWCRGTYSDGPINRATSPTKSGEFTSFHAFYSTTSPSSLTASSDGDGSYTFANGSCCKDSHWYYPVEVYTQTYTTYKKLFTYEKWSDWSDWSDTPATASATQKVETRTLYRYIQSTSAEHAWDEGTVTVAATCTEPGNKLYTCTTCGETKTEVIPALGHAFESGTCTHCGAADPDWREINLSVGSVSATVGETVTIPVTVSNNSGFAGFTLSIEYDAAALKLTAIGKGDILNTTDSGMFTPNVEGNIIQYTNTQDVTAEGTLLYLTFTVLDGAAGKSNDVAVSVKDGIASNFVNEDAKNVNVIAQKGSIEAVVLTPVIQEGKLSVSNERARPGEEVTVSVSIEENPGIMVMVLGIDYDRNKLELIGFENAGLTGWTVNKNAVWIGDADSTYNGVILKLKFKVLDDVEEGDVAVSLMFSAGDIANYNEEAIMPISEAGKITVYTSIAGDLNGDGSVNALDLLRLKKALSGEEVELLGSADVNGDGNVNALDLLRLKKYLSGDNVTLVR